MKSFCIFHWKIVDQGDHFVVVETRTNDIIGGLYPENNDVDIEMLKEFMDANLHTEEEVYEWIDSNIEYY